MTDHVRAPLQKGLGRVGLAGGAGAVDALADDAVARWASALLPAEETGRRLS